MATTMAVDDPTAARAKVEADTGALDAEPGGGMASYLAHPRLKAARGWLDNLRRAVANRGDAAAHGESETLRLEVVRLYEEGRYYEAEVEARRLVDLQKEAVGEAHPDFATALSNLALLLQKQGDLDGAEALLGQTIAIRREALGEQHPDFAGSLNNLALLLCERHDLEGAEPLLRQSLEIRRETLGETHVDYATGLSSLALLLCGRHDLDGAEPLLRQALEIRRDALGEFHPDYATSLNNLALLLCERSDLDGAEPLLRQAFEIRRGVLGPQHGDTLSSLDSLARIATKTGRPLQVEEPEVNPPRPEPLTPELAGRRGETAGPAAEAVETFAAAEPESTDTSPHVSPPPRESRILRDELDALRRSYAQASEALLQEAARMQGSGLPPDLSVLDAAAAAHRGFASLRAEALRLAETVALSEASSRGVASLDDLGELLHLVAEAEVDWSRQEETRRGALNVLGVVLELACRSPEGRVHLESCQARAGVLRATIASCPPADLPPEAELLATGDHPLANVATLVLEGGELSEDDWTRRYEDAVAAFGQALAVAIARGRVYRDGRRGQPR